MIKLFFKKLFCRHDWDTIESWQVSHYEMGGRVRCKRCGKEKVVCIVHGGF
jgi:hypothetical protein